MIQIDFRDPRPIYEQVRNALIRLMISGVLPTGSRMPSVRELASGLAINPNTIQRAYRELESEGYICSVPGKGSFVCDRERAVNTRRSELFAQLRTLSEELRRLGAEEEQLVNAVKGGDSNDQGQ